jgi:RNA polymerase sigma factor (sigma-70 family)
MKDLVEENMGLVISIVNRFNPKNTTERDDFIQAGRIGLWKAIGKFREDLGSKFSPYAWNPIRWEIMKEIRSSMKHRHLPLNLDDDDSVGDYLPKESFWELVPSSLTVEEMEVIKLRLDGNNFKEMSEKLDCNRSVVKKIFDSAIKKIRDNNE